MPRSQHVHKAAQHQQHRALLLLLGLGQVRPLLLRGRDEKKEGQGHKGVGVVHAQGQMAWRKAHELWVAVNPAER